MANTCTVCRHKDRAKIDAALARGESSRPIASQFSVGYKSVQRHQECIVELLEAARKAASIDTARNIDRELGRASVVLNKMLDACEAYLTDPEDHSRYSLDPRAEQVQVIYTMPGARGKAIRKKDLLSTLIARMESSRRLPGLIVERVEMKAADPRELLIKAIGRLEHQVEIIARLTGAFKDKPEQPQPAPKIDTALIYMADAEEQGREITREEAERLAKEDTEKFIRLARKTGQDVGDVLPTVH